jgi:hypothetical protein
MKLLLFSILALQASLSSTFEIPFKLPFGITLPFLKSPSSELLSLHKELVSIPSITGDENALGLFLATYLQERNYTVERIPSYPLLTALIKLKKDLPGKTSTRTLERIGILGTFFVQC